jgi:hypothetical protein
MRIKETPSQSQFGTTLAVDALLYLSAFATSEQRSHDPSGQPDVRDCGVTTNAHTADMNHADVIGFHLNIPADGSEIRNVRLYHPKLC